MAGRADTEEDYLVLVRRSRGTPEKDDLNIPGLDPPSEVVPTVI